LLITAASTGLLAAGAWAGTAAYRWVGGWMTGRGGLFMLPSHPTTASAYTKLPCSPNILLAC
jgi:hypothetical protein